jgi:hypothetical protein
MLQDFKKYTIQFTGTPPNNMRYKLTSDAGTRGVMIKVPYPNAGSFTVKVNGKLVMPNAWDVKVKAQGLIDMETAVCGTNRYVGVENYLEFFITPGCTVIVNPRDAILCNVRL